MGESSLVSLDELLPSYLRNAFSFQQLNRMQSECIEAWNSEANLVISAPTGAGKTVCFELAILRIVHQTLQNVDPKNLMTAGLPGKIVYIAPTKSLCFEKTSEWTKKFKDIGLRVEAVTGDSNISTFNATKLQKVDLLVATAEKWDSATRGIGSGTPSELSNEVCLLLLDEVHQLGNMRGASFEAVVTRMLAAQEDSALQANAGGRRFPVGSLRVIAVSATVPNIADIGRWLRVSPEHMKVFDGSYRPVLLEHHVVGFTARNPWLFAQAYNKSMLKVLMKYSEGKPGIVFCTSRKQTAVAAQEVVEQLRKLGSSAETQGNALTKNMSAEERARLCSAASDCGDTLLGTLLPCGVGYHNADMSVKTRRLVESLFRDSLLPCLFSTSTLAQGVNLPARLVVIAGTTIYNDGSLQEYDQNLLMQMCGRAGRPGLDCKGVTVIMTPRNQVAYYNDLTKRGPEVIRSQLASRIEESINAEIARQVITDVPTAVLFLSRTFCWSQRQEGHAKDSSANKEVEAEVNTVALNTINTLVELKLAEYDEDLYGIHSTAAGLCMARYCLSLRTMKLIIAEIPQAASPSQVLKIIASCPDVLEGACLRRSERKRLNEMNEIIRMPVQGRVKDAADKTFVLLQLVLGDHPSSKSSDSSLKSEGRRLLERAGRVSGCILVLSLQQAICTPYESLVSVLQVCRGLQKKCFWDGRTSLKQILGITPAQTKALCKGGLSSIAKVAEACVRNELTSLVDCRLAFAKDITRRLSTFPKFIVKIKEEREIGAEGRVTAIYVNVSISSQTGKGRARQRKNACCFILIGSHCRGLLHCTTFPLQDGKGNVSCEVVPEKTSSGTGKWIDVVVGCDNVIGVDYCQRLWDCRTDGIGGSQAIAQDGQGVIRGSEGVSRVGEQRMSLSTGRVTKKFSQQKLSFGPNGASNRQGISLKRTQRELSIEFDAVKTNKTKQESTLKAMMQNATKAPAPKQMGQGQEVNGGHVDEGIGEDRGTTGVSIGQSMVEEAAMDAIEHSETEGKGETSNVHDSTALPNSVREGLSACPTQTGDKGGNINVAASPTIDDDGMPVMKKLKPSPCLPSRNTMISQKYQDQTIIANAERTQRAVVPLQEPVSDVESSSTLCEYDDILRNLF